jgi:hypothetical protein
VITRQKTHTYYRHRFWKFNIMINPNKSIYIGISWMSVPESFNIKSVAQHTQKIQEQKYFISMSSSTNKSSKHHLKERGGRNETTAIW